MTPEDVVLDAANSTCSQVEHENFVKLSKMALDVCGADVLSHVDAADRPGLFSPAEVQVDGKWRMGCILTLHDRAVVAWWTGNVRIKNFALVVPYSGVEDVVRAAVEPATRLVPEKVTLRVVGSRPATVRVMRFPDGLDLPAALQEVLAGTSSIRVFGEPGDTDPPEQAAPAAARARAEAAPVRAEAAPVRAEAPECPGCGAHANPGARFCRGCGRSLGADAPAPARAGARVRQVALGALLLALLGGGAAFAVSRGDGDPQPARTTAAAAPAPVPESEPASGETAIEDEPASGDTAIEDEPASGDTAFEDETAEPAGAPELTQPLEGDGYVAEVPSSAWEIGEDRSINGGRLRVRLLRGPDGAVIRIVHSPDSEAEPDADLVVDESLLKTAAAESRMVTLDGFPTDECEGRLCSDFVLNDPAYGGLALLVNAVEGDPAFAVADAIARTVRSEAQADEDPERLAPAPGSDQSLPPEIYPAPG